MQAMGSVGRCERQTTSGLLRVLVQAHREGTMNVLFVRLLPFDRGEEGGSRARRSDRMDYGNGNGRSCKIFQVLGKGSSPVGFVVRR